METYSVLLAICAANSRSPVNSPHKGQWRGALMFSLICARINGWVNNGEETPSRQLGRHWNVTYEHRCHTLLYSAITPYLYTITYPIPRCMLHINCESRNRMLKSSIARQYIDNDSRRMNNRKKVELSIKCQTHGHSKRSITHRCVFRIQSLYQHLHVFHSTRLLRPMMIC